jgi:UDP-glucose 4-epimerase
MRVLVTGGSGSIGAWVVHELVNNDVTPIVFDYNINKKYFADIEEDTIFVEGDVTVYDEVESAIRSYDPENVIHLAKLLPPQSEENPLRALRINVLGSGNVLKAASEHGINRVVFSSSKTVFAGISGEHGPPEFIPITEDYPKFDRKTQDHIPFYSTTNKMVEYFGIRFAMQNHMEFVILRFGSTWGPGKLESERKRETEGRTTGGTLISRMIEAAVEGRDLESHQGKTDNATYTKDIAQGVAKAALSDEISFSNNHREFLLDAGKAISHTDFAKKLTQMYPESEIHVDEAAQKISHRGGGTQCVFDLTRAKDELGYSPRYADVADAIEDYVKTIEKYEDWD